MIVQTFVVILILGAALICDVNGASYSNVYVESEVAPMGYYQYGTPYPSISNPRLSEINTLPSVPTYIAPCMSPCVYPAQTVATVPPVNSSPKVLTYSAPSVPVAVAPNKEATGYEYSYVVYDKNTGDHKAQRELSDGSVVRGEYSFLQPDGYVRQVQYVADDISGFNAVVKNYLPVAEDGTRKVEGQEKKESLTPCHETQNESLKKGSEGESGEILIKHLTKNHEKLHQKYPNEESADNPEERHHSKSKDHENQEKSEEKHHMETKKASKEESAEESSEKHAKKPKQSKEESSEESEEISKEKHHSKSKKISNEDSGEESDEDSKEESKGKHQKKTKKESKESGEESEEELESEETKEELKEKTRKKSSKDTEESREKIKKKSNKGSKDTSDEDSGEESEELSHGKNKEAHELLKPSNEAIVPYKDIIRCIEAAMKRTYGVPAAIRQEPSPLTYIVLNKPC